MTNFFPASRSNTACKVCVLSSFYAGDHEITCNRIVSVVESGDLILGSFNVEIRRTKVLCYIRCVWV